MEEIIKTEFKDLIVRLKEKYPSVTDEKSIVETVEFAVFQYIRLSNVDDVVFTPLVRNWVKRACFESLDRILKLGAVGGIKQYSENGYQFTLDGVEISTALAGEIIPRVGYPK
ncbi:hypothetical protein ACWG0P_14050 [Amedibacillus sp. YH-ame6]